MRKLVALLVVVVIVSAPLLAQSSWKPSAAIRDSASREHRLIPPPTSPSRQQAPEQHEQRPALRASVQPPGEIPIGTAIRMKLDTAISTHESKAGDTFSGTVSEPVLVGTKTVIPSGAFVTGHIERASEPRRIAGLPTIAIRPESVQLPTGDTLALNAVVVDTDNRRLKVDDEGRIKGGTLSRRDVVGMTLGTGGGATVGAIIAGAKGTLVGAGAGAALGTTMWLARRHSVVIPVGTEIVLELNRPLRLQPNSPHIGD